MNITKQKFFTVLAAVVSLMAIGAMVPGAARAVYSSPVTVFNTTSQPVPGSDVEKMARIPYESTALGTGCPTNGTGACFFNFTGVPSGYRLVVENLSGYFQVSPAATTAVEGYLEGSAFRIKSAFSAPLGQLDSGGHFQAAFNSASRFYVDPGEGVFAVASSNWSNGASNMVLSGYLESCAVTGCPAVQH
jgi:hypothetical protein